MKVFTLVLHDRNNTDEYTDVNSFVGEDHSGSFGILAGHARMMTSLVIGLSRFRIGEASWQYIATPGALLYFNDNKLVITTRHFLIDDDYMNISNMLKASILHEENLLSRQKQSFRKMEEEILKRLWKENRYRA